jgi:L-asparaginase / beta-aspartyl-peptidase
MFLILVLFMSILSNSSFGAEIPAEKIILAVHGGAGVVSKKEMTPEMETAYRNGIKLALDAGIAILKQTPPGSSLDAVEATVKAMEDCPLFNAGKGANFTKEGRNELDSAIMDGKTLRAGAVGAVTVVKHPVSAARAVMERTKYVLLTGRGAELLATEAGLDIVDNSYFWTQDRWKLFQDELKKSKEGTASAPSSSRVRFGTVGAVALDTAGNLAAATSTGGLTMKRPGRLGDSPVVGSGTYANNRTCAVSCTGDGEYFMRVVAAYDVSAQMEYKGISVVDASQNVLKKVHDLGGEGGMIALDAAGHLSAPFNGEGMYRGYVTDAGRVEISIY